MSHHHRLVRAGVVAAVGFLALDAVLLAWAGWWTHRPGLVLWGALLACLIAVPVHLWRRYRRHMDEVRAARHAMAQEVHHLQMALRERQH
jgi:hypothetical protein